MATNAWGKCTVDDKFGIGVGEANPFRYRSYYYDTETGFYFLQSRYYDPETGRFISPDDITYLDPDSVNGLNLYAYCGNNPVMYSDPSGKFGIMALLAIALTAMFIGGGTQLLSNASAGTTGGDLWRGVAGAALGSGANALALCLLIPTGGAALFIAAGIGALVQTGVDTIETVIRDEEVNWGQTGIDLALNFITTLGGNFVGGRLVPTNTGWFQPKNFLSIFIKPYGQRILLQTLIGAGWSGVVNFLRKYDWSKIKPNIATPSLSS